MHYKNTLIVFILLVFLALPFMVLAQPEKDIKIITKRGPAIERIEMNDNDENFDMPILNKLKLTDDQQKEFMRLRFDMQKKQTEARAKVQTAQIELRELFTADNPDHAAVEKQIKEIADLKTKLHLNRLDHWFAVNKILKPEQQKIWKKHLDKNRGLGMKNRGMRFGQKIKMRIDKEIRRGNPDCPNMNLENN